MQLTPEVFDTRAKAYGKASQRSQGTKGRVNENVEAPLRVFRLSHDLLHLAEIPRRKRGPWVRGSSTHVSFSFQNEMTWFEIQ